MPVTPELRPAPVAESRQALSWAEEKAPPRPAWPRRLARLGATVAVAVAGILGAMVIWSYYITAPWTRDGRLRVQVANVSPQVAGRITEVHVVDDQFVHEGDLLYVIDPVDYRLRLAGAVTSLKKAAADVEVKRQVADRLMRLSNLATTAQAQQQAAGDTEIAQASFDLAQQQQQQAQIDLARTQVRSPVTGFVTNLLMRVGDYARTGTANVSVIDTGSFWIDGYFEETKLGRVCRGDKARAQLMGFGAPILGEVDTIARGISVTDATPSTQGLPSVNPVYTWVRLAQRVPVRIRITEVPPGVPLVSGLTATVTLDEGGAAPGILARVGALFAPPAPRPGCIPVAAGGTGPGASLPDPQIMPALTPTQVDPNVAPGLTAKPTTPP